MIYKDLHDKFYYRANFLLTNNVMLCIIVLNR